ncbi:GNAT superfamily N-acetyltransferase [Kitasatospora sp. GAS204A]|nr:GNAT superfamily N-acetyltransferase [Kitasatospora sp. GAS204B]
MRHVSIRITALTDPDAGSTSRRLAWLGSTADGGPVASAFLRAGGGRHAVAAIVGFTELVVPGDGRGDAQHYGTGVLPEHRGHGLGRWMKAAAIRQVIEQHPDLEGLLADTAASNRPMRAINEELGYRPTHNSLLYQLDL